MNMPFPIVPLNQAAAAARLAYAVASWDECVSLVGDEDADTEAVLDQAERELCRQGIRCIRVCGFPSAGLSLRGLMAQVAGRADPDTFTDGGLEAGFKALTEPGQGYDRVALLVTKAHGLLPSAVRYIQFACRSSPKLLVVLAGQPSLAAALADDEFAYLRRRITRKLQLPDPAADDLQQPFSTVPKLPSPVATTRRPGGSGTLARLGLAAAFALVVLTTRWGGKPTPSMTATHPGPSAGRSIAESHTAPHAPVPGAMPAGLQDGRFAGAPADQRPVEAAPPTLADMQGHAEPAAPEQERTQTAQQPIEEASPPAEQDPAPFAMAEDAPAPQPPPETAEPAEVDAAIPAEPPAAPVQEHLAAPVERAEHATAPAPEQSAAAAEPPPGTATPPAEQDVVPPAAALVAEPPAPPTPEPPVAQVADPAPPPGPTTSASLPVPPLPPRTRAVTALPPPGTPEKARRARREAEWNAVPVEASPTPSVDGARCRDIVLRAQIGEGLSDADKRFMRSGCRTK